MKMARERECMKYIKQNESVSYVMNESESVLFREGEVSENKINGDKGA